MNCRTFFKFRSFIVFSLLFFSIPSFAVEFRLGESPSYMRTRIRFINNGTFLSSLSDSQANGLGFQNGDDNIAFVDSKLRVNPQLVLSKEVTLSVELDVVDNAIWGGLTSGLLGGESTLVNSSLNSGDRFRGALLVGTNSGNGAPKPTDNDAFFIPRTFFVDLNLPKNFGFVRIGRQPFQWGIGLLANCGDDPLSDLGFIVDQLLYRKSWPVAKGDFTFIFVSGRIPQGNSLVAGHGDGYDIGAVLLNYNRGPLTLGTFLFPYLHQNNFGTTCPGAPFGVGTGTPANCGFGADLQRGTLYNLFADYDTERFRLVGELDGLDGNISIKEAADIPINNHLIFVARGEYYPKSFLELAGTEFGFAQGGSKSDTKVSGGNEGGIVFNPAYNIDNLLFKHMIPNVYQIEGSAINAIYAKAYTTFKLHDRVTFTPQLLFAWNDETNSPLIAGQNVRKFLGTEFEGTFDIEVVKNVNLDIIGSAVFLGGGLKDLLAQQASFNFNSATNSNTIATDFNPPDVAFTFQGRLLVYIDKFFKKKNLVKEKEAETESQKSE
jgi:hypothetical protein